MQESTHGARKVTELPGAYNHSCISPQQMQMQTQNIFIEHLLGAHQPGSSPALPSRTPGVQSDRQENKWLHLVCQGLCEGEDGGSGEVGSSEEVAWNHFNIVK